MYINYFFKDKNILTTSLLVTLAARKPNASRKRQGLFSNNIEGDFCWIIKANKTTTVMGTTGKMVLVPCKQSIR